jgi:hypothetical protein
MVYLIGIFSLLLSILNLEGDIISVIRVNPLAVYLRQGRSSVSLELSGGVASQPQLKVENSNLSHYIAGLVEGDGSIKIPNKIRSEKGKILYPSVTIIFADKDLPLAETVAKKLKGTVNKGQGNYYVLSIYSLSALHTFAQLVNGKFRTPKIEALHRLITWLNSYGKFESLVLKPLDDSNITSNGWLAGFADCDSNFLITFNTELKIAKNIQLTFRLSHRQTYHRTVAIEGGLVEPLSYFPILSSIASAFNTKATSFERTRLNSKTGLSFIEKGYLVTAKSLSSRLKIIDYFSTIENSLLSSKRMDYLDWVKAHELVIARSYRTEEGTAKLIELKSSMNTQRTNYDWSHLEHLSESR